MPQYQGIWNLAQQSQALTTQQWVTDPLFDNTTLLLQADNSVNGAQNNTFLDSSANSFTITRNGNTTQGSFSPFSQSPGWWSNYFDGSSNITLSSAAVQTNGAFTVECWLYITNNTGTGSQGFYTQYAAADGARMQMLFDDSDKKFKLTIGGSSYPSTQAYPGVYNTWTHVVFTRDGSNNFSFYINGIRDSVTTVTAGITSVNPMIGNRNGGGIPFYGYISNLRITTTAMYSGASFVVPNTPLQTVTGTTLLTCQSNRFVDNNTALTAKTLTPAGSPSVQAFSPLAPQYQYVPSVTGGSGYFDGTGDYLTFPTSQASLLPGAGAFTYEMWFYQTVATANSPLVSYGTATGNLRFFVANSTSVTLWNGATNLVNQTVTNNLNSWNHIVVQRDGSNVVSIYYNGSRIYNNTVASTFNAGTLTLGLDNAVYWSGYLSGFKATIGSAVYSGTSIPVPTTPPSPTGATACLNFTNAGIYDGTLKNDLETVGNAQVSTAVVKYGSGSLYFDGTGDYLRPNSGYIFNFGTGDFTIEFWAYLNVTTNQCFIDCRPGSAGDYVLFDYNTSAIRYFVNTTTVITGPSLTAGVWNHIALTRANGTVRLFVNGTLTNTATNTANLGSAANPYIGSNYVPGDYLNAYIDDMRITKGIARYTRNFTPPQVALPRQ